MSAENVEIIKGVYERWLRDREIDPGVFHHDFELRTPIMQLENQQRRGAEGYEAWRAANEEVLADDWFEPAEFAQYGERVLVTGWLCLTGRSSGLETRAPAVQLWSFRDGRPSGMTAARTLEEALEAESRG